MSLPCEPCRLCLKGINQKCDFISNNEKDMVQIILPDVNLEICENLFLCKTCSGLVEESFLFKSTCLEIEDSIHNYANEEVQADLEKLIGLKDIDGGQRKKICRTCLDIIDNDLTHELVSEKDNLLVHMLQKCLPEIDLQLTKQPVLCEKCKSLLKKSYSFVCQCMDNEEKISDFQKTNHGKILNMIEVARVISKNKHELPEINISNLLRSSINENFQFEKNKTIIDSVQNGDINLLSSAQPENNVSQTDNKVINRINNDDLDQNNEFIDIELVSPAQLENSRSQIEILDSDVNNEFIDIEMLSPAQLEKDAPQTNNMDSNEVINSTEVELISCQDNGAEIFVISDEEVSDSSMNTNANKQLIYNIRKRPPKKLQDAYAFREDLDNPIVDPDFNPDNEDLSDDNSDRGKRKIEQKIKKRIPRSNQHRTHIYCKYCSFRHVSKLSLDKHMAICEAKKNYREPETIRRQKEIMKIRKEAELWRRLQVIQESLRNLGEFKKHRKKKKKSKSDSSKSDQLGVSMQLQFTLKNAPVAALQTINIAVDKTVESQSASANYDVPSCSKDSLTALPETDPGDSDQNKVDSADLVIIEDTTSTNRTSKLSHKELCVLKCDFCEFNSRFYDRIERHILSHLHRSDEPYDRLNYKVFYWCVNCSSVFPVRSQLREHRSECSQKDKVIVKLFKSNATIFCMVCDFETNDIDDAKLHRKSCNFKEQTVVGDTIEID